MQPSVCRFSWVQMAGRGPSPASWRISEGQNLTNLAPETDDSCLVGKNSKISGTGQTARIPTIWSLGVREGGTCKRNSPLGSVPGGPVCIREEYPGSPVSHGVQPGTGRVLIARSRHGLLATRATLGRNRPGVARQGSDPCIVTFLARGRPSRIRRNPHPIDMPASMQ